MNNEPLVRAIAAAMMFLEESGPDEVDPDSAVRTMETMGYELLRLVGSDRAEFLDLVERVATDGDPRDAAFIRGIPRAIGMVEG